MRRCEGVYQVRIKNVQAIKHTDPTKRKSLFLREYAPYPTYLTLVITVVVRGGGCSVINHATLRKS